MAIKDVKQRSSKRKRLTYREVQMRGPTRPMNSVQDLSAGIPIVAEGMYSNDSLVLG